MILASSRVFITATQLRLCTAQARHGFGKVVTAVTCGPHAERPHTRKSWMLCCDLFSITSTIAFLLYRRSNLMACRGIPSRLRQESKNFFVRSSPLACLPALQSLHRAGFFKFCSPRQHFGRLKSSASADIRARKENLRLSQLEISGNGTAPSVRGSSPRYIGATATFPTDERSSFLTTAPRSLSSCSHVRQRWPDQGRLRDLAVVASS